MKVAVVGAAGQVGAAIMRRLCGRGDLSVVGITRNEFSAAPLRHQGFDVRSGSVLDPADCRRLLDSSDLIVNAALHIALPKVARTQNETIIRNLLQQAPSSVVVHLSTVAVYGSCLDESFSTFERPRGDSTYAREKLRLEQYASDVARRSATRLAILRLGHVYGPGQGLSKQMFSDLETGRAYLPFGGQLPSNAVHVHRLADAIPGLMASFDGVRIVNAVDAPQSTWREVFDLHARAAGLPRARTMPEDESRSRRAANRAHARHSTAGRLMRALLKWMQALPLRALVDAQGVREAMDVAMLRLPGRFEEMVYRRYQGFATRQRISAEVESVPPWYFSDAAPGPQLLAEVPEGARQELREKEVEELGAWYSTFSAPNWKVAVG